MKYKCHLNYFVRMALVVNILKTAITTYLGKHVSYRKETERSFRLWYNRLFGILLFCKYKETSNCEISSNSISRKCILLGDLKKKKNHQMAFQLVYQLYCIFFPLKILKLLELSFCHISKTSIYSVYKPFIVYRLRILSDFISRTCMNIHNFA